MMIIINRVGELISGSFNGKQFSVTFDEQKFEEMKKLEAESHTAETIDALNAIIARFEPLTAESYKEIVETASPYIFVNKHTNKFYLRYKDVRSNRAMPQVLVDRMLKSLESNTDITPLIKFWVRCLRSDILTGKKADKLAEYIDAPYIDQERVAQYLKEGFSEQVAKEYATSTQVAITIEGLLAGYKVSEEVTIRYTLDEEEQLRARSRYGKTVNPDTGEVIENKPEHVEDRLFRPLIMKDRGDAFHSVALGAHPGEPGHFIRVGNVHYLDSWDKVNCNDNVTGDKGLHVGGLRYIDGYRQQEGAVTHCVLIDPMDIGAIVGLGSGSDGAMRVRRYFVHSSFAGPNKNIYHSSKYAALNDAEYAAAVQEAVLKTEAKHSALDKENEEKAALV